MRVALAQITLDGSTRSQTIQHVLAAIDRAADAAPAPDLIVLPGHCGGAARSNVGSRVSLREAVAHRAREWGVFVALGIGGEKENESTTLLFDADGDCVVQASINDPGQVSSIGAGVGRCETPFGVIGIVSAECVGLAEAGAFIAGSNAVVAVPLPDPLKRRSNTAASNVRSYLDAEPVECDAHWAIVVPATPAGGGERDQPAEAFRSVLRSPAGKPVAVAASAGDTIVTAEAPLRAVVTR